MRALEGGDAYVCGRPASPARIESFPQPPMSHACSRRSNACPAGSDADAIDTLLHGVVYPPTGPWVLRVLILHRMIYRGGVRKMTIATWDLVRTTRRVWPVVGGDKPLAVAPSPLAPARRARPSSPVERVPIGHSMHCASCRRTGIFHHTYIYSARISHPILTLTHTKHWHPFICTNLYILHTAVVSC